MTIKSSQERCMIAWLIIVEIEEEQPVGKEVGRVTGKWDKRANTESMYRRLTRLRSAVLSPPRSLPASTLLRFVNPPTLLPMLLLKTPLLPELDMVASICV